MLATAAAAEAGRSSGRLAVVTMMQLMPWFVIRSLGGAAAAADRQDLHDQVVVTLLQI